MIFYRLKRNSIRSQLKRKVHFCKGWHVSKAVKEKLHFTTVSQLRFLDCGCSRISILPIFLGYSNTLCLIIFFPQIMVVERFDVVIFGGKTACAQTKTTSNHASSLGFVGACLTKLHDMPFHPRFHYDISPLFNDCN